MTLILCVDDNNGIAFNNRRQSMDRVLRQRVLNKLEGKRLWMNTYTAGQFEPMPDGAVADDAFLDRAGSGDFCFIERQDPAGYMDRFDRLILYRWNKAYPADVYFDSSALSGCWSLVEKTDFPGHSHVCITEELYERKEN